ncbi:MAG: flippase-like domain-containing protein, partial [Rhodospirillaceae bacterium]|nr:flippase-like domain-containing protein [Rhodospirillaceae bacterium]
MKKFLVLAIKAAVSFGVLWYLAADTDGAQLWELVRKMGWGTLALAFSFFIVQIFFGAIRWSLIAGAIGTPLSWRHSFAFQYIGLFFNLVLPGMVGGDAIRIWKAHKSGMMLGDAFTSVALERVATFVGVALMIAVSLPSLFERIEDGIMRASLVFVVAGVFAAVGLILVMDRLPNAVAHWRIVRAFSKLAEDTRR